MNVRGFTEVRPAAGASQVGTVAGQAGPSSGAARSQVRRSSLTPTPRPLNPTPVSLSP